MKIDVYKTARVTAGDCLYSLLDRFLPRLEERSILAITSKIVSLSEGCVVEKDQVPSKEALIRQSADAYLDIHSEAPHAIQLTIKNGILIPSAGIDESNGNGVYILYPTDIQQSARAIWDHLRQRDKLQELGIVITDSHTTPMRRGVIGIGLGYCGFKPLYNYIGKPDCFGVPLRVTQANHLDALAAAAVFCMGEGNEQTPLAVIRDAPRVEFQSSPPTEQEVEALSSPLREDLYAPLLESGPWVFKASSLTGSIET
jgi:dihydrofolate synthase / folylpolyglutamate synthase